MNNDDEVTAQEIEERLRTALQPHLDAMFGAMLDRVGEIVTGHHDAAVALSARRCGPEDMPAAHREDTR